MLISNDINTPWSIQKLDTDCADNLAALRQLLKVSPMQRA
jgi:hypothetical protein